MEPSSPTRRASAALRLLYLYTVVGAGAFGLWTLAAPTSLAHAFGLSAPDPYLLGISGAVDAGFALVAALGLRRPVTFAPVFVLQLVYKSLWLGAVFVPHLITGTPPASAWVLAGVFVSYVGLDLIAIPFGALFSAPRRDDTRPGVRHAPSPAPS